MDSELCSFYGFDRSPFEAVTDAEPGFHAESRVDLIQSLVSVLLAGCSVVAVTGARGIGKTHTLHLLASQLALHQFSVLKIPGSIQDPLNVQRLLGETLGVAEADLLRPDQVLQAARDLRNSRKLVLLIDDADRLSTATVRYLWHLVELGQHSRTSISLVLFAQLGTLADLEYPDALGHAAFASNVIFPLSDEDAAAYLDHKLTQAGRSARQVMTKPATIELLEYAQGIPGEIDALTELALLHGYRNGRKRITRKSLRQAIRFDGRPTASAEMKWVPPFRLAATAFAVVAIAVISLGWLRWPAIQRKAPITAADSSLLAPPPDEAGAVSETPSTDPSVTAEEQQPPAVVEPPSPSGQPNFSAPSMPHDLPVAREQAPAISGQAALGGPGLVLVAEAGDSMATLYEKVYRGRRPPPYSAFVAANRTPVAAGSLVVFPEPPGGWSSH